MHFTPTGFTWFFLFLWITSPLRLEAQERVNEGHLSAFNLSESKQGWNQWLGPGRDGVWRESGILKQVPSGGLKEVWRTPIAGGFAGPATAGNHVYVTDYLLKKGDQTFDSSKRSQLKGTERVHCLNIETGKSVWTHKRECDYNISFALGPRATPTVDKDRVYTLGAEGLLLCLSAVDGKVIWEKQLKEEYGLTEAPLWGFAGHPLVHGNLLYCLVGGEGSVAVAFNKMTGEEVWRALSSKEVGYCPPTLIRAGGVEQLIIWHNESINSLNPQSGEVYWTIPSTLYYAVVAPVQHGEFLLVTGIQGSTMLLKLDSEEPQATVAWREKGTRPDHNPPIIHEGHIYGVDFKGKLRCIELVSGKRIWESLATCPKGRPVGNCTGFIVRNDEHWYITTEQGELIIAEMSPKGFKELGRHTMLEPTSNVWGRQVVWSHPAFANKCIIARNDKEIVCYSLAQ